MSTITRRFGPYVAVIGALALMIICGQLLGAQMASASTGSYFITQHEARWDVKDAAQFLYSGNGVTVDGTYCRPQFVNPGTWSKYDRYHRWTCGWTGTDEDGADVYGAFRITGHSNGRYGYLAIGGGLRWDR